MNLEISIESEHWNCVDVENIVAECVKFVFADLVIEDNDIEICFLFADNDEVKILNKTYRGIDKATNVLSFPVNSNNEKAHCGTYILGSSVFAYSVLEQEAIEQEKSFSSHLKHIIVHSILHLLGYNHLTEVDAERMESIEIRVLSKLNVPNPYE